jgi:phospholipid/cholesterol/gamma-HCH transport system substrate-binding protein
VSRRRSSQSIVANPVLVGAVTTLVVVVAVFLAYNANNGLPFVPTKEIKVQLASGSNLVKGNEVREGGFRVGVITDIAPITLPNGSTGAEVDMKLDKAVGDVPADSTIKVRPRSALGLKYLELTRGTSGKNLSDGDTIDVGQTVVPVQFDEIFKMFDAPTREASQENLTGFGNALAGRGIALNETIAELPRLFGLLTPVMSNLASPQTNLRRFFSELGDAARVIAPIADVQVRGLSEAADTFEAIARDPQALQDTIAKSPRTLSEGTVDLREQRPFLRDTVALSRDLRATALDLRLGLPTINDALEVGTPVVRRTASLNGELRKTMASLQDLVETPATDIALRGLIATVSTLNPQLRYLGPYVTVCNFWNYFWTFVAEHFSEQDPTGQSQRALLNMADSQEFGVTAQGAAEPASGQPTREPGGTSQNLHGQPYGAAINDDGTADCEAVQRGYPGKLNRFGKAPYDNVTIDSYTPGSQGPTFKSFNDRAKPLTQRALGPDRPPAGETFSRYPETGPVLSQDPPR